MTPRIYVASLTDYNAGTLHGWWIDADQDADSIMDEVRAMLAASPTAKAEGGEAEGWGIHDFDDFGGVEIGRWDSFEHVAEIAELLTKFPAPIVAYYMGDGISLKDMEDTIRDSLCGEYEGRDEEAIADMIYYQLADRKDIPEDFRSHLIAIARSMAGDEILNGTFTIDAGNGMSYVLTPN